MIKSLRWSQRLPLALADLEFDEAEGVPPSILSGRFATSELNNFSSVLKRREGSNGNYDNPKLSGFCPTMFSALNINPLLERTKGCNLMSTP